ncbi:hypothetical protein FYJ58_07940 [Lachnospiraceae bacterium WCA-693-APC-MOT-I]|uniref:Uncharacterized protein n=1 Tax=Velocimicrobium porci TaxID=2606634 RepID=A0A6L5XY60_9FIRM|nr:hypothetical protein [Velocimicrobium porci]
MGCKQKAPSKKILPTGERQTKSVTLEDWGKVNFVSLFPDSVENPVRFYLTSRKVFKSKITLLAKLF